MDGDVDYVTKTPYTNRHEVVTARSRTAELTQARPSIIRAAITPATQVARAARTSGATASGPRCRSACRTAMVAATARGIGRIPPADVCGRASLGRTGAAQFFFSPWT